MTPEETAIVDLEATNAALVVAVTNVINSTEQVSSKDVANGYAGLDATAKINPLQLPGLAITSTYVVASEVAQLVLTVQVGDVAVRTDESQSYIAITDVNATMADWQVLLAPTDAVSSVFGRTTVVTAQSGDYTADQITETATGKILTDVERTAIAANTAKTSYTPAIPTEIGGTTPAPATFTSLTVEGGATADILANVQTGTAYTLALTDAGKLITFNNGLATTVTIPANASAAFRVGTVINLLSLGAGIVTVTIISDILASKESAVSLVGQYSAGSLIKMSATQWVLVGDIT
jgi:hypothetical protein